MQKVLIVCKSITHAQKIQSVIRKSAFWCGVDRTPQKISDKRCSYSITVNLCDFDFIYKILSEYRGLEVKFYVYDAGKYTLLEV